MMFRTEKEIREEIRRLEEEKYQLTKKYREKIEELKDLLRLNIEKDEVTQYYFYLTEDKLVCEKYASGAELYVDIDRETLNKLFSWLVGLKAIEPEEG